MGMFKKLRNARKDAKQAHYKAFFLSPLKKQRL